MPVPISLLIDDACPLVHVYRYHLEHVHGEHPLTKDGRPLLDRIPNSFLDAFCRVMDAHGFRGKLSIVPAPAARGDVVAGVDGDPGATREWLDTVKRRLSASFDFSPEGITHDLAVNLATGALRSMGESVWSQLMDRGDLTPYLARGLRYLRDAGIDTTGVTSPWIFGREVESEYIAAIIDAQREVYNRDRSWYFLHSLDGQPKSKPWVAFDDGTRRLVSIPTNVEDVCWRTIDDPRSDPDTVHGLADQILTADGRAGQVRAVLAAGGWPLLLTHWQSLFSNGLRTGLAVFDEVGRRVRRALGEEVRWTSCSELMTMTLEAGVPRPPHLPAIKPPFGPR